MAYGEDVWDLEPILNDNDDCATPPEEQTSRWSQKHYWEAEHLANRSHDCHLCRKEITPGEYYQRLAIPLHDKILVFHTCSVCYNPK